MKIRKNSKIDKTMNELVELKKQIHELTDEMYKLENTIKNYMELHETEELEGTVHHCTYKLIASNRIDTVTLKQLEPEVASRFTVRKEAMRFLIK